MLAQGHAPRDLGAKIAAERDRLRSLESKRSSSSRGRRLPRVAGENADPDLVTALKAWRSREARAAGVPAYVIFHDTTLAALAEARPRNERELLAVPGLGPVKVSRYGAAVLAVLAEADRATA